MPTALARTEFTGWMVWPVTEAVAATAVASPQAEDFDDGLALLPELTPRLTSEFALRTFLDADLERTLRAALAWAGHEDPAVRRLASEGTRPPGALGLLGFSADHPVTVTGPTLRRDTIAEGDDLEFDSGITNNGEHEARLLIDYVIHYRKANGATAPRVFKLSTRSLQPGETITITRRHSFKVISTRRHHPGRHAVEMQVNGVRHGRGDFTLTKP